VLLPAAALLALQTVAYDGSNFAGFQYQTPKVRTVQGELERAAGRVLLPAGRVVGASRTDGGAHATGQVAHLDVTGSADSIQPASLMMYMNGVLPDDVKVQQLQVAPAGRWTCSTYKGVLGYGHW
jgi:tRNA pseudouridine38-40 synthase